MMTAARGSGEPVRWSLATLLLGTAAVHIPLIPAPIWKAPHASVLFVAFTPRHRGNGQREISRIPAVRRGMHCRHCRLRDDSARVVAAVGR